MILLRHSVINTRVELIYVWHPMQLCTDTQCRLLYGRYDGNHKHHVIIISSHVTHSQDLCHLEYSPPQITSLIHKPLTEHPIAICTQSLNDGTCTFSSSTVDLHNYTELWYYSVNTSYRYVAAITALSAEGEITCSYHSYRIAALKLPHSHLLCYGPSIITLQQTYPPSPPTISSQHSSTPP